MTNVLIYSPRYFPTYVGGGERLAQLTAAGMRAHGIRVSILTDGPAEDQYEFDGVHVDVAPAEDRAVIERLFARLKPDVVHLIGAWGKPTVATVARATGAKFGAAGLDYGQFCDNHLLIRGNGTLCNGRISAGDCFRCSLESARPRDRWLGQLGKWIPAAVTTAATAAASAALGRSMGSQFELSRRFEARDAARQASAASLDLFVVPTRFAESKTRPHLDARTRCESLMYPRTTGLAAVAKQTSPDSLVVGFIGRCLPMKGLHVLLDAIDRLAADAVPVRVSILTATNDGEAASYWTPLKARVAADHRVTWKESGFLDPVALRSFHTGIDVLAVPSLWPEYVGFVTLEALALGTRVLLSDFPSQRELILDDSSGMLVPPGDADALARALRNCWNAKQRGGLTTPRCLAPSAADYAQQLLRFYGEVAA